LFGITLKPAASAFLARGRTFAQRDRHFLDAAVAQVLRMGVALAAIAEHGDLLARDQVEVAIGVVINFHFRFLFKRHAEPVSASIAQQILPWPLAHHGP
jgi:hypothetical protein